MKQPKKVYLIDTNILLRHVLADHQVLSPKARKIMDEIRSGKMKAEILEGVLIECVYVLNKFYKVPREKVADTLIDILSYKGIVNKDKSELINALKAYKATQIDIVDHILASKSTPEKPVLSFDKDFKNLDN